MKKFSPSRFPVSKIAMAMALSLGASQSVLAAEDAAAEQEDAALEVITVTAQKRVQNLQAVPVSVTAITGDAMAESVIKDMYDLQANVPALAAFQSQSATNSSFSIRGVGTSSQNFGLESSVGLYVDGVYRARQNSMINNLVDIESVQVLRGPQGTLFGKNTPSGAILVNTIAPSHDGDDAFVELTVGNYGLVNYSGAVSISAIEDVLAFRITGFGSQRDGTIDDANLGDNKLNDRNRWGARLQALYTPSDSVTVRIIADYSEIDEICCGAPAQLSNNVIGFAGAPGTDFLLANFFGATIFSGDDIFDRKVAVSFLPESTMEDRGLSAEIDWELDNNYTITSVSAYRSFDSYDKIDTDFTDADLFNTVNDSQQSSFSQELRLTYSGDKFNYIVGAYYFQQDLDLDYSLTTGSLFNPFFMAGFGGALDPLLGGIDGLSAATGGLIAPSALAAPAGTGFDHTAKQQHESWALFGQFDYNLSDKLILTAGLRYTDEKKDLNTVYSENLASGAEFPTFFDSIGDPAAPVPGSLIYGAGVAGYYLGLVGQGLISPFDPAVSAAILPFQSGGWGYNALGSTTASRPDINESLEDNQVTGSIKLSYLYDDSTMMYVSYGTGYKSGGTNTDRIADGFNPIFGAELSNSFEVGLKKDFPEYNLRINAAGHYTQVEDFQANTWTGNGFNLQNAGDYVVSGGELEVTWLPTDTLEINIAYALVKATFDRFENGNCWTATPWQTGVQDPGQANPGDSFCDRSGDRPSGEPEDTLLLSVTQELSLFDNVYSYVQVDYNYVGDMVLDASNDPYAKQDAYNVFNARFYMNIEAYDMDVILWGRNVFNEEYINRTNFNAPIQAGRINAYLPDPATYGITLKKRF